jgi:hypothetical protein
LCSLLLTQQPLAQSQSDAAVTSAQNPKQRDGQHDFDFEIGTWKTHVRRLLHPLTGSTTWIEYDGITVVRKVWNGRANLVELVMDGPAGHFEGLSLRLYNPVTHQWSLNFANSSSGAMGQPTIGQFKNGRGEFFDQETLNDRAIFVRFVVSDITPNSCRFEQSFSDDGGKNWELNWIATDTRVTDKSAQLNSGPANPGRQSPPTARTGQTDFDFNFGIWKSHIKRLRHPLAGSKEWIESNGAVGVSTVWNGRGNLEEIEADGPAGHIEGLTLRLYNPESRQWYLSWANSNDGTLSKPMVGEFKNGQGVFFDQESFRGRTILVRQIYSDITPNSYHFDQSFSDDGGKTWESNWIATVTRVG